MTQFQTGVWYDHSHSAATQGAITLPKNNGNIFLSFLTVMVTVAGACAWTIVSLLIHSYLVRSRPDTDLFDLQQQVTLRNAKTPLGTIYDLFKIHGAWSGRKVPRLGLRTAVAVVPALLLFGGMMTASIFTSKVVTSEDGSGIALALNQGCGVIPYSNVSASDLTNIIRVNKVINETIAARNYAINFYGNRDNTKSIKSKFVKDYLPYKVDVNASCMYPSAARCNKGVAPIRLESEMLDSHSMFGINAKPSNRIGVRTATTCGLASLQNLWKKESNMFTFYMGGIRNESNYTVSHPATNVRGYTGYHIQSFTEGKFSGWNPISDFKRADADVSVIFLNQNGMKYAQPVKDPYFLADNNTSGDFFTPSWAVNPLLCYDQYMICNPVADRCSSWAKFANFTETAIHDPTLGFNDAQHATAARMTLHMQLTATGVLMATSNNAALYASNHIIGNDYSTGLPDNQWHLETTAWFQTKLAKIQASAAEYVRAPDEELGLEIISPHSSALRDMFNVTDAVMAELQAQCETQLVMSNGEVSTFSLAGMLIIIVITALLAVISFYMQDILDWVGKFFPNGTQARLADDKLQILRLALASNGGPRQWEVGYADVPVTSDYHHVRRPDKEPSFSEYPLDEQRLIESTTTLPSQYR
ncbi:unnamed protein product [Clonostachys rosea f. rosea IK726]|uniref:Uncharacterized protein n=2 Tax=Bionectria ochroleuca TaxID=29856 RepID=A0A0B7K8N8_BIOOC|nr:unnamed protein product [Clonostachys rosea f. rosea IK726]